MSRPQVHAERMKDPAVAAALRQHREDRQRLLTSLTASLQADQRVRAAWLWGSFGRGEADDLSDLDPWIIVTDEATSDMGPRFRYYTEETGNFISGGEAPQNAPAGGGFFGSLHEGHHGLLHVDCYWQPQSAISAVPERGILFHRLHESPILPQVARTAEQTCVPPGLDGRVESGIDFAWLMFSIAAKTLARYPDSDMGLMFYPKSGFEEAKALLGQEEALGPVDWYVPEEPLEKVARLRHLAGKVQQLTLAANAQGFTFSPLYAPCLSRYLDMVEGILRSTR